MLVLHSDKTRVFPRLPESIRILDITHSMIEWSLRDVAASPLPNLESLKMGCSYYIKNAHVLAVLEPFVGETLPSVLDHA